MLDDALQVHLGREPAKNADAAGRIGRGGRDARWDRRAEPHSIGRIGRRFFRSVPTRNLG